MSGCPAQPGTPTVPDVPPRRVPSAKEPDAGPSPSRTGGTAHRGVNRVVPPPFYGWLWLSLAVPWRGSDWLVHVAMDEHGNPRAVAAAGNGTDAPEALEMVESAALLTLLLAHRAAWSLPDLLSASGSVDGALRVLAVRLARLTEEADGAARLAYQSRARGEVS